MNQGYAAVPFRSEPQAEPRLDKQGQQWQLVERILASSGFAKSSRLCSFLTYICERALEGHNEDIHEQQIGIRVFGRPAAYNPS